TIMLQNVKYALSVKDDPIFRDHRQKTFGDVAAIVKEMVEHLPVESDSNDIQSMLSRATRSASTKNITKHSAIITHLNNIATKWCLFDIWDLEGKLLAAKDVSRRRSAILLGSRAPVWQRIKDLQV